MKETLHKKLKEVTQNLHHQAEHNTYAKAVLQEHGPIEKYIQWLIKFYGFYFPIEKRLLTSHISSQFNIQIKDRLKIPLIYQDLKFLGQTDAMISNYPQCTQLPDLSNASSLLGFLYVVEGSSLGGQHIQKKLNQIYSFKDHQGSQFFNCYGGRTLEMWQAFCTVLNEYPCDEEQEGLVIQGALRTFETLNAWLNTTGENNE